MELFRTFSHLGGRELVTLSKLELVTELVTILSLWNGTKLVTVEMEL